MTPAARSQGNAADTQIVSKGPAPVNNNGLQRSTRAWTGVQLIAEALAGSTLGDDVVKSLPLSGNVTDRTRTILRIAQDLAARHGHEFVSPEHIALGLLRDGDGPAIAVLLNRSVPLDALARELEDHLSQTSGPALQADQTSWAPASVRVFEQAKAEARLLGQQYIGTEHLLLGLIRDTASVPAEMVARHGLRIDDARTEVLKVLGLT